MGELSAIRGTITSSAGGNAFMLSAAWSIGIANRKNIVLIIKVVLMFSSIAKQVSHWPQSFLRSPI